jgi:hypothetical protein
MSIIVRTFFTVLIGMIMIPVVGEMGILRITMRRLACVRSLRLLYLEGPGGSFAHLLRPCIPGAGFITLPPSLTGRHL